MPATGVIDDRAKQPTKLAKLFAVYQAQRDTHTAFDAATDDSRPVRDASSAAWGGIMHTAGCAMREKPQDLGEALLILSLLGSWFETMIKDEDGAELKALVDGAEIAIANCVEMLIADDAEQAVPPNLRPIAEEMISDTRLTAGTAA
jgi:hypothetical protein